MANHYLLFSKLIKCSTNQQANSLATIMQQDNEDWEAPPCSVSLQDNEVWLYSEENADIETIAVRLATFQLDHDLGPITLSWALTCSKPRPDQFGGGAVAIVNGNIKWFDPESQALTWAKNETP
jgi:hypothetical protein